MVRQKNACIVGQPLSDWSLPPLALHQVETLLEVGGADCWQLDRKGRTPAEDTSDEAIKAAAKAALAASGEAGAAQVAAEEAKKAFAQEGLTDEEADEATARLYQVKRGMPTHRQFMRMMEDAQIRKKFEKFDLEMNSDYNKVRAHELKEDLHYVIDEKNQQADLTENGRSLISPDDPNGFVIPDLATISVEY